VAKLHYLVSGTYYLGGIATTLTIWLPIFFLFFQIYAIRMPFSGLPDPHRPYAIVSTLIFSIVQMWYSHKEERGFAWRSAVLEKATWNIYLSAFLNAVQGRKVPYLPTPKEGSGAPIPRLVWPHWLAIGPLRAGHRLGAADLPPHRRRNGPDGLLRGHQHRHAPCPSRGSGSAACSGARPPQDRQARGGPGMIRRFPLTSGSQASAPCA